MLPGSTARATLTPRPAKRSSAGTWGRSQTRRCGQQIVVRQACALHGRVEFVDQPARGVVAKDRNGAAAGLGLDLNHDRLWLASICMICLRQSFVTPRVHIGSREAPLSCLSSSALCCRSLSQPTVSCSPPEGGSRRSLHT